MDVDRPIAGPVSVPLNSGTPTDIGVTLEQGEKYIIVVQGVGGVKKDYPRGVDPVYRSRDSGLKPGQVRPSYTFKLPAPETAFYEVVKKSWGRVPPYNPAHVYHAEIEGNGRPLKAILAETTSRNYMDNIGAFSVTVYKAPLKYWGPPREPRKGEAAPAIDADAGETE